MRTISMFFVVVFLFCGTALAQEPVVPVAVDEKATSSCPAVEGMEQWKEIPVTGGALRSLKDAGISDAAFLGSLRQTQDGPTFYQMETGDALRIFHSLQLGQSLWLCNSDSGDIEGTTALLAADNAFTAQLVAKAAHTETVKVPVAPQTKVEMAETSKVTVPLAIPPAPSPLPQAIKPEVAKKLAVEPPATPAPATKKLKTATATLPPSALPKSAVEMVQSSPFIREFIVVKRDPKTKNPLAIRVNNTEYDEKSALAAFCPAPNTPQRQGLPGQGDLKQIGPWFNDCHTAQVKMDIAISDREYWQGKLKELKTGAIIGIFVVLGIIALLFYLFPYRQDIKEKRRVEKRRAKANADAICAEAEQARAYAQRNVVPIVRQPAAIQANLPCNWPATWYPSLRQILKPRLANITDKITRTAIKYQDNPPLYVDGVRIECPLEQNESVMRAVESSIRDLEHPDASDLLCTQIDGPAENPGHVVLFVYNKHDDEEPEASGPSTQEPSAQEAQG